MTTIADNSHHKTLCNCAVFCHKSSEKMQRCNSLKRERGKSYLARKFVQFYSERIFVIRILSKYINVIRARDARKVCSFSDSSIMYKVYQIRHDVTGLSDRFPAHGVNAIFRLLLLLRRRRPSCPPFSFAGDWPQFPPRRKAPPKC